MTMLIALVMAFLGWSSAGVFLGWVQPENTGRALIRFGMVAMFAIMVALAKPHISWAGEFRSDWLIQTVDGYVSLPRMINANTLPIWLADLCYWSWFHVQSAALVWACWSDHGRRLLLAWVMLWTFGGTVLALLLSSSGPFYAEGLTQTGSVSAAWQARLAEAWCSGRQFPGSGISAMPSMHVGVACLVALAAYNRRYWLWPAALAFLMLTQIVTVVQGWHWSIDGYVSIVLAMLAWMISDG
ncbi:hypothetical protein HED60_23115 [Planctomycetales bacterium ZRK34]|nr:hypothetical protein HED60_23115 [Planctomycetales bacterium ZRK34]